MKICRTKTVAFSGHRTCKMSGGLLPFDSGWEDTDRLPERLEKAIRALYDEGYDTFLCGMAEGFDLQAAEAVIRVREQLREQSQEVRSVVSGSEAETQSSVAGNPCDETAGAPRLIAVIPHRGQSERFPEPIRKRYATVLEHTDDTIILSETYFAQCFHRRNDYLTDHADVLLCYYNGSKGGTQYTVRRALKSGLRIVNMA